MNRKISTLMASLLFASAFVGTADAAIKIVDMSKAPAAGKYIIATALASDADGDGYADGGKATGVFTGDPTTAAANSSSGDVLELSYVWTIEKDGENYYFKNSNGKYIHATSDWMCGEVSDRENASAFTYNKTDKKFYYVSSDNTEKTYFLSVNASSKKPCVNTGNTPVVLGQLTADITERNALASSIDKNTYYFFGSAAAAGTFKLLKNDGTGTTATYPSYGTNVDALLWKITSTKVGDIYVIGLENKANKTITKQYFAKAPYENGINLYSDFKCTGTNDYLTDEFAEGGTSAVLFGAYEATAKPVDGKTLNAQLGNGFQLTIDTEKDKKATIEGADILSGTLTAVDEHRSHIAIDNVTRFQLMTADSSFIVVDTKANWGISGLSDKGLKFAKISKEELAKNAANYWSWFEIAKSAGATDAVSLEGIIAYDKKKDGVVAEPAQLYTTAGKNYLMVTEDENADLYPYVALGSSSVVEWKELFTAPAYYNIIQLNKTTLAPVKALGIDGEGNVNYVDLSKVQLTEPEGQWEVKYVSDDQITLINREQTGKTKDVTAKLRKTDKTTELRAASPVYQDAAGNLIVLNAIGMASTTKVDGFVSYNDLTLRDEEYTLGFYSNVLGASAYLAENHVGGHQLGLEKDVKNAASWKLTAHVAEKSATAATDSVYVMNEVHFWNANKKGGADWDKAVDTLKIVPYTITNVSNNEPLYYSGVDTLAFICNPKAQATRFVIKKAADGKYNLLTVKQASATDPWTFDSKVYAGFSANYGNIQLTGLNNKTENDLVVIEPRAAPEYVKLSAGDTIRIFREGAEASLLFEKGEFLGMENVFEFSKMAPAMFVDTAHIEKNRYEYLLAVEPNRVVTSEECTVPGHPKHETNVLHARFLVNLVESAYAEAARNIIHGSNKYINSENFAKLGFVPGYHEGDTLVINNSVFTGTTNAKNDSIQLNSAARNVAKFAFKVVDQETKAFVIETGYKTYPTAAATEPTVGYLKWMNGAIVVVPEIANADVYNLKATDEDPTANEAIAAEGVQVIGGQGAVTVQGAAGKVVTVANILGQTIANQVAASDNVTIAAPAGIVVVAVEGEATKVVVK